MTNRNVHLCCLIRGKLPRLIETRIMLLVKSKLKIGIYVHVNLKCYIEKIWCTISLYCMLSISFFLGINGLEELSLFDSTLHAEFYDEFFSETAKNTERTMQLQEENKKLDQCIQTFLLRLSPYILLRPTQKILEWLIFRFLLICC